MHLQQAKAEHQKPKQERGKRNKKKQKRERHPLMVMLQSPAASMLCIK
jgi:hypothetical protein